MERQKVMKEESWMMMMACQHIPTMTKSHHGGNIFVMIKVGTSQCQIATIHDKLQLQQLLLVVQLVPSAKSH